MQAVLSLSDSRWCRSNQRVWEKGEKQLGGGWGWGAEAMSSGFLSPVLGTVVCAPFSAGNGSESCLHLHALPQRPSAQAPCAFHSPWGGRSRGTHPSSVPTHAFPALGTHLFPLATMTDIFLSSTFMAPLCPHVQHPVPFCPKSTNKEDFRNISCNATFSPSVPRWSKTASVRDVAF